MRTEDFDDEYHCFENDLRKVTTAYRQAKRKLEECFEHWSELGRDLLGGQVAVNFEHDVLTGSVSGRMFTLNLSPLVVGKENHVLVVLSVPDILNQESIEIDRFLFSINGEVLSMDGQRLHCWDDDCHSYKLLIAVSRAVLRAIPRRI